MSILPYSFPWVISKSSGCQVNLKPKKEIKFNHNFVIFFASHRKRFSGYTKKILDVSRTLICWRKTCIT